MARTARGSTAPAAFSMQALDNLNLDDMLDEGGDDLFGDMGIDLGTMDDITGAGLTADVVAEPLPSPEEAPASPPSHSKTTSVRKTKRKTKAPIFYEDNDEDTFAAAAAEQPPPAKKKKRGNSKGPTMKKGGSKTAGAIPRDDDAVASISSPSISTTSAATTKGKKAKGGKIGTSATLPRTSSMGSNVAAAGQFGRRGGSFSLPKGRTKLPTVKNDSKSKGRPVASTPSSAHGAPDHATKTIRNLQQVLSSHPGLKSSAHCGISASDTLFYPFLPTLPTELAMKTRKVHILLEKIQTFFANAQQPKSEEVVPAAESEAIFKLIQEVYRDNTNSPEAAESAPPDRDGTMKKTIGFIRSSIGGFDKIKLAGDLYALCSLLKRQHDFLKQNLSNMEQWCKTNLPESEYAAVYVSPKSKKRKAEEEKVSLLSSFPKRLLKVAIACTGFKEPKMVNSLQALLPPSYGNNNHDTVAKAAAPKSKKRKLTGEPAKTSKSTTSTTTAPKEKVIPYWDCKPPRRRKMVGDMLSRVAREVELRHQRRVDDRNQARKRQESELRKLIDDDEIPVIHTMGMWRWIAKSGLFTPLPETEVRDRLAVLRQGQSLDDGEPNEFKRLQIPDSASTTVDRLTSLLVEEDALGDATTSHETMEEEGREDVDSKLAFDDNLGALDLAALSLDERSVLHRQALGLNVSMVMSSSINVTALEAEDSTSDDEDFESVEEVLKYMMEDLARFDSLNSRRADHLESLSQLSTVSADGVKRRKDDEANIIAKCQQVVRRNRDGKSKSSKLKTAKDEMALPW